jgi:hypothetical protein
MRVDAYGWVIASEQTVMRPKFRPSATARDDVNDLVAEQAQRADADAIAFT